jgi:AcrR family transcriptional regulator
MHTRRTEDFRERLLEAGVALFAETGYHGTGVKDIVERAGVPKGSIRVFFEPMSVGTRLRDYRTGGQSIATLIAKLEEHGLTALGERGDVTLDVSRQVYQFAV